MAHNRHRGQKDGNHKQIVAELEAKGFVVFDVSGLKSLGFDIVVYRYGPVMVNAGFPIRGQWTPFEIKSPGREKNLTPSEWKAQQKAPIPIVSTVTDILRYF